MIQAIHHAVVHKLDREAGEPSVIHPAPACLDVTDAPLWTLIEAVHKVYSDRQGKSYGVFDPELTPVSAEPYLQQLRDQADADFYGISIALMQILKDKVDPQNFATGGHVLMFDFSANGTRWFVVAIVNSAPGTMVDDDFKVVQAPHLDVDGIRFAGRVNFPEWERANQRYISFLRGKTSEVSQYFQKFLGCSTSQLDMADTRNLVKVIKQFAVDQNLDDADRERLLGEVNSIAFDKAERQEPLDLGELANRVWPQAPEELNAAFAQADPPIADGFVPRKRGLDGLVRFKAKTAKWKLEFEREAIQDHTIHFDPDEGTLTIRNLPADILASLTNEFSSNANPDDPAN